MVSFQSSPVKSPSISSANLPSSWEQWLLTQRRGALSDLKENKSASMKGINSPWCSAWEASALTWHNYLPFHVMILSHLLCSSNSKITIYLPPLTGCLGSEGTHLPKWHLLLQWGNYLHFMQNSLCALGSETFYLRILHQKHKKWGRLPLL